MPIDIDGLSLEELVQLNHRVVERIKMLQAMQAHVDMMAFNLGARVSFDTQDGRQLGTLVKYNRKTVTVLGDDGRQWRVSPGLLSPVKDVEVTAGTGQSKKVREKKRLR
jgi:hypothetical protein